MEANAERVIVRDQLEGLVAQMVERGILFDEAVGELRNALSRACWTAHRGINAAPRKFWGFIAIR